MPRVVPEYKAQARARILDAAFAVFRRKGLVDATMDDVAREVGVSKGAIYLYFPSKVQLIAGVLGHLRDEMLPQLERLTDAGDLAEATVRMLDTFLSGRFDPAVWHFLNAEAATNPEVRAALKIDQQEDTRIIGGLLVRLEAEERIPHQSHPDEAADAIMMLLGGAVTFGYLRGETASTRRALAWALRALLRLPEPEAPRAAGVSRRARGARSHR